MDGREVDLAEGEVVYKKFGSIRVVAKRDPDGKQVHIVTSLDKEKLRAGEVYRRMVGRWCQENFFKYMKQELALDSLVSYEMVPADGERLVPNPKWKDLDRAVRNERTAVKELERRLGASALAPVANDKGERDAEAAITEIAHELGRAEAELERRLLERKATAKHVPVHEAIGESPKRLEVERKTFTDALKMMAYRAETALVNIVASTYSRAGHEARTLIQEALHLSGDLDVGDESITIRLEPMSSPHRTRAITRLCEILTDKRAIYPGTDLRMRFALRSAWDRAE